MGGDMKRIFYIVLFTFFCATCVLHSQEPPNSISQGEQRMVVKHHDSWMFNYPDAFLTPFMRQIQVPHKVMVMTTMTGTQKNGPEIYTRLMDGRVLMVENFTMGVKQGPAYYGMHHNTTLFVNYNNGVLDGDYVQTCLTNVCTGVFSNGEWKEGTMVEFEDISGLILSQKIGGKIDKVGQSVTFVRNVIMTKKAASGVITKETIVPDFSPFFEKPRAPFDFSEEDEDEDSAGENIE
jgi:hypothetical protein